MTDVLRRLDNLEKKLDIVIERQLSTPSCPAPGSCLHLAESMKTIGTRIDHIEQKEIERLDDEIVKLRVWQGRIGGGLGLLLVLLTIFGPALRKLLGTE